MLFLILDQLNSVNAFDSLLSLVVLPALGDMWNKNLRIYLCLYKGNILGQR